MGSLFFCEKVKTYNRELKLVSILFSVHLKKLQKQNYIWYQSGNNYISS